jgi:lysophospholipase L1-like esterase
MKKLSFYAAMISLPLAVAIGATIYYYDFLSGDPAAKFQERLTESNLVQVPDAASYADNWRIVSQMVPVPYTSAHYFPNVRGPYVNTNDLGYRGTVNFRQMIDLAKRTHRAGGVVCIFTGGSAAFGCYSVDDGTCIVGHMNRLARGSGLPIKVLNFGMAYYTSDTELAMLTMYGSQLDPDLLIVMDGFNDALRVSEEGRPRCGVPLIYPSMRQLFPMEFTSEFLDSRQEMPFSEATLKEITDCYGRNLATMCRFMRAVRGDTILATQPIAGLHNRCTAFDVDDLERKQMQRLRAVYHRFSEAAKTVGTELAVEYVDLTNIFKNYSACNFFADNVHMTSVGQQAVAEALFPIVVKKLRALGKLPASTPDKHGNGRPIERSYAFTISGKN